MTNRVQKLSIISLKYAPVIAASVMMIHVCLLLTGVESYIADWTFSLPIFPCVICMLWSKAFGFCRLHRLFILYTCIVSYCIKYQDVYDFGVLLTCVRLIMLFLGIVLLYLLIFKKRDECNKCFKETANKCH